MAAYKAIVTGGARGIGYALTSALVAAGGKVVNYTNNVCTLNLQHVVGKL